MSKYHPPAPITLTEAEQKLLEQITWDIDQVSYDAVRPVLRVAGELAESLFDRNAVPQARLDYFTDPDLNIGSNKSRQQVFESNGTSGHVIYRHPDFLKYLRYFILGPHLPTAAISGFCRILNDDVGTSGMVMDQLRAFARSEVRKYELRPNEAGEEFFKLGHELGISPHLCRAVRGAARTTR